MGDREIVRIRVSVDNRISFVRVIVPELVPRAYYGDKLVGSYFGDTCGSPSTAQALMLAAVTEARKTKRPVRTEWPSIATGRQRIGIVVPEDKEGWVTVRVFATAEEVADLPDRRCDPQAPAVGD